MCRAFSLALFPIPFPAFPIPFLAFPNPVPGVSNPAPAFSSDGSGSASFYRCAPAAALPHSRPGRFFPTPLRLFPQSRFGRFFPTPLRRLSAPHGKRFSGGGPAGVPAWNPQALLPCAGGGARCAGADRVGADRGRPDDRRGRADRLPAAGRLPRLCARKGRVHTGGGGPHARGADRRRAAL